MFSNAAAFVAQLHQVAVVQANRAGSIALAILGHALVIRRTKRFVRTVAWTGFVFLASVIARPATAEVFRCSFSQEEGRGGRSNAGSCSMDPEYTMGTKFARRPDRTQQCRVSQRIDVLLYFKVDVTIDTDAGEVLYYQTAVYLSDDMRRDELKQLMGPGGLSRKEAEERMARGTPVKYRMLDSKSYSLDNFSRQQPDDVLEIRFFHAGERPSLSTLFIPKRAGKAILSRHAVDGNYSFISMDFGECSPGSE